MADRSALVTGAAGHCGAFMIRLLKEKGWHVVATDLKKDEQAKLFQGAKKYFDKQFLGNILDSDDVFIAADLTKKETLEPIFNHEFDTIFSIASLYDYFALLDDLMRINVGGLKNLIELTLEKGNVDRFLHWSTCGVYGQPKYEKDPESGLPLPSEETAPYDPPNNYSTSKMEQEKLLHQYYEENGLPITIIRPAPIMGPYQTYGAFHVFYIQHVAGMTMIPLIFPKKHKPRMPCIHVEDLVRAAYFLATYKPHKKVLGEAFNVVHDSPFEEDFIQLCADSMGLKKYKIPVWFPLYKIVAKLSLWLGKYLENKARKRGVRSKIDVPMIGYVTHNYYFSNQKLKNLGFEFKYDWEQATMNTINWYFENRWFERGF
ncbi:MAG: NAD-dependent epimerase/dehydratase family protein [Candidatus Lokiarchaeota archaeon]|nr:NAD-dependent epimerase/dehydratase family protein [Candidatus Lokiarchaeota archaeon]